MPPLGLLTVGGMFPEEGYELELAHESLGRSATWPCGPRAW